MDIAGSVQGELLATAAFSFSASIVSIICRLLLRLRRVIAWGVPAPQALNQNTAFLLPA